MFRIRPSAGVLPFRSLEKKEFCRKKKMEKDKRVDKTHINPLFVSIFPRTSGFL